MLTNGEEFKIGIRKFNAKTSSAGQVNNEEDGGSEGSGSEDSRRIENSSGSERVSEGLDQKSSLDPSKRYLQIAFNDDLSSALRIIRTLPKSDRIIVEVGTPLIKSAGVNGRMSPTATKASVVSTSGPLGLLLNGLLAVRITKITSVCVASDSTNQPVWNCVSVA